jgi:hypothetical protein
VACGRVEHRGRFRVAGLVGGDDVRGEGGQPQRRPPVERREQFGAHQAGQLAGPRPSAQGVHHDPDRLLAEPESGTVIAEQPAVATGGVDDAAPSDRHGDAACARDQQSPLCCRGCRGERDQRITEDRVRAAQAELADQLRECGGRRRLLHQLVAGEPEYQIADCPGIKSGQREPSPRSR